MTDHDEVEPMVIAPFAQMDKLVAQLRETQRRLEQAERERDEWKKDCETMEEVAATRGDALRKIAYMRFDVNASAVSDLAEAKRLASEALASYEQEQPPRPPIEVLDPKTQRDK